MKIESLKNEKIKYLRKQKDNKFLLFLDNPKTIREAIAAGFGLQELLVSQTNTKLQAEFSAHNPIITTDAVIAALSDTKTPQGIIAVFLVPKRKLTAPKTKFLVLDTVQDAGNTGTLLRTAKGAGFNTVFMLDCTHITNPKTVRSSMGAIFSLNIHEMKKEEFMEFAKEIALPLITADMDGESVFETDLPKEFGLVLGNEGQGVSKELSALCTKSVAIPMQNDLESLNVAVAGGIIMFETIRRNL
ncbi:MAG: RNA methyltransferase [Clostridia bacterium]|nr:RNA methyltransferase [Clostridia bacterium]